MNEAVARPGLLGRLTSGVTAILAASLLFGAFGYLTSGPGRVEFMVAPGNLPATVTATAGLGLSLILLTTRLIDHIPWQGVIRLPTADGYRWTRSALSRLLIVLFSADLLWWWTGFVGMVVQAWYQADWARLAVAAMLGLGGGALALRAVLLALSRRTLLSLDAEGLFARSLGRLAWSEIEKIVVGRDPSSRQVYLFLNAGRSLGPARALALSGVGLTAGRFVGFVEQVAPQMVIERPEPPPQLFGR